MLGLTVRWNTYRTIYYDDPTIRTNSAGSCRLDAQGLIAKLNMPGQLPAQSRRAASWSA